MFHRGIQKKTIPDLTSQNYLFSYFLPKKLYFKHNLTEGTSFYLFQFLAFLVRSCFNCLIFDRIFSPIRISTSTYGTYTYNNFIQLRFTPFIPLCKRRMFLRKQKTNRKEMVLQLYNMCAHNKSWFLEDPLSARPSVSLLCSIWKKKEKAELTNRPIPRYVHSYSYALLVGCSISEQQLLLFLSCFSLPALLLLRPLACLLVGSQRTRQNAARLLGPSIEKQKKWKKWEVKDGRSSGRLTLPSLIV